MTSSDYEILEKEMTAAVEKDEQISKVKVLVEQKIMTEDKIVNSCDLENSETQKSEDDNKLVKQKEAKGRKTQTAWCNLQQIFAKYCCGLKK